MHAFAQLIDAAPIILTVEHVISKCIASELPQFKSELADLFKESDLVAICARFVLVGVI